MQPDIRNIGIIAHVDHGKTTLVDCLLKEAGVFRENQRVQERAMDSMDLEQEKGITIRSKNAAVNWQGVRFNIVDTPGHADFGGEVERILKMVDGVLLLVDAAEGPQAQTRFVLRKALDHDLALVVVVNKIDRDHAEPLRVHDDVLELLLELDANEEQFHAPFLYTSAKEAFVQREVGAEREPMSVLLDVLLDWVQPPRTEPDEPFRMLVSNLDWSDYVGRIAIGRITSGRVSVGDALVRIRKDGVRETTSVTKVLRFAGLGTEEVPGGNAGDIVALSGLAEADIGDTLCASADQEPLPFVDIDPPTIMMQIGVNDGPLAGRDGRYLTARHIQERLIRETRTNISLEYEDTGESNFFTVRARGDLQIAVLVETMRREGYEVLVSRPQVIYRQEAGRTLEPYETLWVELPNEALGDTLQTLASRKARVDHMEHHASMVHLEAVIPTRGLIGFENYLINRTGGGAVMSHMFKEYAPLCGDIPTRTSGTLVAVGPGQSTAYALDTLQERGRLFIGPQEEVYEGMVVGENARSEDLPVNPTRTKQLTNVRASGSDKAIQLEPPVRLSLEKAIEFIAPDEYVEVTPNHLRLRKKILNATQRKRAAQKG